MTNGDDSTQVRRGAPAANPLQPLPLILWRGTAEGVARMEHSEQDPHDYNNGLYLTRQRWLAEEYARLRSGETGGRPLVYEAEISRNLLGRILDLESGQAAQDWHAFLGSEYVPGKTWRSLLPPENANRNYWTVFRAFLEKTGRKLDDYDTIIGPEYVRVGSQICVRSPEIQRQIQQRFVEYESKPVWIRVLDGNGAAMDVDINYPGATVPACKTGSTSKDV
jgi:hypothetical protein